VYAGLGTLYIIVTQTITASEMMATAAIMATPQKVHVLPIERIAVLILNSS
jgi:hypothetical protein